MSGPNAVLIALLREHAAVVRAAGGDPARYDAAARAIARMSVDVCDLDSDALAHIRGVDPSIVAEILEFLDTGHVEALDALRLQVADMTFVPS